MEIYVFLHVYISYYLAETIESVGNNENTPNKKYKMAE